MIAVGLFSLLFLCPMHEQTEKWNLLARKRNELEICEAISFFHDNRIRSILFKGFAAARNYPIAHARISADIDIAVPVADCERAAALLKTETPSRMGIDLHREFRQLDTVPWQTIYDRCGMLNIEGVEVRVPRAEDHLRILAVHWLTDGGQYKERLYDIYYAVLNRPAGFDWSMCLDSVSETRRKWVITTIGLAHKYLGLDISELPFASEAIDIPQWITKCVEREWASDVRLRPIQTTLRSPKLLVQQIRKRIPPNPIQATIDMEGSFDDGSRVYYQLGSVAKRIGPSIPRVGAALVRRSR